MAERERDPLPSLAQAWRAVAPPHEDAELSELDAETRRAVALLRAAWDAVAAPAAPALAAPRPAVGRGRARPWAAAAAMLLALGAAAASGYRSGRAGRGGRAVALRAPATLPFGAAAGVGVERATPGRIELRSGNVRLVLLTGGAPGAHSVSDDERMDR